MSDQMTREAAARAFLLSDRGETASDALYAVVNNPNGGWWGPDGADMPGFSASGGARDAWLAWAKADAAHARAQLAREASTAQASHTTWPLVCATCGTPAVPGRFVCSRCPPLPTEADAVRESAPVAPAMTLDAMREALTAAGYEVVAPKPGGFERPDLAMARAQAQHAMAVLWDAMSEADKNVYRNGISGPDGCSGLASRLGALGVAPAALK